MSFSDSTFMFKAQELPRKLEQFSDNKSLGYWQIKFDLYTDIQHVLYLGIYQNLIFYSGDQTLCWSCLWQILSTYILRLRKVPQANKITRFKEDRMDSQNKSLRIVVNQMIIEGLLEYKEVVNALKLQILTDFDTYVFHYPGQATFIEDRQLINLRPIPGFDLKPFLTEVNQRQLDWKRLQPYIPSVESIIHIDEAVMREQNLQEADKIQLRQMIATKKNLGQMAKQLGKTPLSLAKVFVGLVQKGSATVTTRPRQATQAKIPSASSVPKIFIVDDSPVMIKQFKRLATTMGYQVESCQEPLDAIALMLNYQPKVIFFRCQYAQNLWVSTD